MRTRKSVVEKCAIALSLIFAGFAIGAAAFADDDKDTGHNHDEMMKRHVAMFEGADGAAKAKEMMLMMSAHQYLLGEMAQSEDVKRLAATADMKRAIEDVKASLKDHARLDAKKDEVAMKEDEAMMVIAHALLKQDAEAEEMLKAAEEGKSE